MELVDGNLLDRQILEDGKASLRDLPSTRKMISIRPYLSERLTYPVTPMTKGPRLLGVPSETIRAPTTSRKMDRIDAREGWVCGLGVY